MTTKRITPKNLIFTIPIENVKDLTSKIDDLTKIDEKVILNIDNENSLFYSLAGGKNINAFKSHILKTNEYFDDNINLNENLKFIFTKAKKFFKILSHFKDFDEDVKAKIIYNDEFIGERFLFKNSKLKLEVSGALPHTVEQSASLDQIKNNMNTDKANFSFTLSKKNFEKIKKLSGVDIDNKYYDLIVKNNVVLMGETSSTSPWTLEIDEIESPNDKLSFPKQYFNTIKIDENDIEIYCFNHYILIMTDNTNLMITTELSV